MVEGIYRLFDSIWRLSLVGSYCILLVMMVTRWITGIMRTILCKGSVQQWEKHGFVSC